MTFLSQSWKQRALILLGSAAPTKRNIADFSLTQAMHLCVEKRKAD